MKLVRAIVSGIVGATVLTLIHEVARRRIPDAPRMDILGMRAIAETMHKAGRQPPSEDKLFRMALIGDILGNTAYYSGVGAGEPRQSWLRGVLFGLGAGLAGVLLPSPLGLGSGPSSRTPATRLMTIAWYMAAGLAAATASSLMSMLEELGGLSEVEPF